MFAVMGKITVLALKGAWGLTKILFTLIFLPVILIGMVFKGFFIIAIPALIIIGLISLTADAS